MFLRVLQSILSCRPWSISTIQRVDIRGNKFSISDKGSKNGEIADHVTRRLI